MAVIAVEVVSVPVLFCQILLVLASYVFDAFYMAQTEDPEVAL